MSKVNSFLEEKVIPVAGRIAGQRHLQALRDGILMTMPLIIVGSVFLVLGYLPIPGYSDFMAHTFGAQWLTKLTYPVGATFDIMALIAAFAIAYRLAEKYNVDALAAGAVSVAAFLLATPYQVAFTPAGSKTAVMVGGAIPSALMGSKGLFVAMLIAMLSTEIYRWIIQKDIVIKMPDGVPPSVSKSFVALIPAAAVLTVIWVLRLIVENTSFGSLHNIVGELLGKPLGHLAGTLPGMIVIVLVQMLLWSCGLHGSSIVSGVMAAIWLSATDENRVAFQAGDALPHIFTQQFFDNFINIGGSGATLGLALAMLLRARSEQSKQLGRLAFGPALFNINEPIIFGMPIVMNPIMMVPFILGPVTSVIVTYFAMKTGMVAKTAGIAVPWTMPPIISGYMATGGKISGAVIQLVTIAINFLIYYPFFRIIDKQNLKMEQGTDTTPTSTTKAG
ncbi:PTS cellobiose transporter subunit IIC [Ectobacillus ponti]|uniref:Permease IIC component n=1 Tax=Ectobacillus ponti TaxID=2961894 RepID=A0AA42BQH8_9BACI|nr:PTS cellobiose transporter subunit IIC [Ectobacillus ponti]